MYEEHRNIACAALADVVTHELSNQTTWVWNNMFSAISSKDILKIRRALTLIDCIWTAEERRILVNHLKPVGELIPICKIIQNRVVLMCCKKKSLRLPHLPDMPLVDYLALQTVLLCLIWNLTFQIGKMTERHPVVKLLLN